jgi:hypothetical protein
MKGLNAFELLQEFCGQYETEAAAARALGITKPYLADLLRCRRSAGPKVLAKLGLKRVLVREVKS